MLVVWRDDADMNMGSRAQKVGNGKTNRYDDLLMIGGRCYWLALGSFLAVEGDISAVSCEGAIPVVSHPFCVLCDVLLKYSKDAISKTSVAEKAVG